MNHPAVLLVTTVVALLRMVPLLDLYYSDRLITPNSGKKKYEIG